MLGGKNWASEWATFETADIYGLMGFDGIDVESQFANRLAPLALIQLYGSSQPVKGRLQAPKPATRMPCLSTGRAIRSVAGSMQYGVGGRRKVLSRDIWSTMKLEYS